MEPTGDGRLRLPELIAALTLGIDLGLGQPVEHVLRSCLVAMRLAALVDASDDERRSTYYTALLSSVGCTADASEIAAWFGDDNRFRREAYDVDLAGLPLFGFMLRRAGGGGGPLRRARLAVALVAEGSSGAAESMEAHCDVAATLAERLGLGRSMFEPMRQIFARWDGKGYPALRGDEIALPVRLVQLADIVEGHRSAYGVEAALSMARERRGKQFDPDLVDRLGQDAAEVFAGLGGTTTWDDVIAADPEPAGPIPEDRVDEALTVIADFADLKSPFFRGHSRGVSDLAADAAGRLRLAAADVTAARRSGLVHDLGRTGVPNTIWDKPGPLSERERERVRLHAYYTERALARPGALARLAPIAAAHHERLDGTGYHRGLAATALSPVARVLAAADAYHAMTEPRPHRPALSPDEAAAEIRRDVHAGRLDAEASEAVLAAAGHRTRARGRSAPDGLTPRELEVLVLVARGASNKEIAKALVIAEKTAANHVEHIYAKIDVSTRATAALYAMRHGLLDTLDPLPR